LVCFKLHKGLMALFYAPSSSEDVLGKCSCADSKSSAAITDLRNKKEKKEEKKKRKITYNTGYSLVVTDPTTNPALTGLSRGERTGSRVLQWIWSYVLGLYPFLGYI